MADPKLDPFFWYGQPVKRERLHEIVAAEVEWRLGPHGFKPVDVLKWVRDDDAPIRQLFALVSRRGIVYMPQWGVSLDFAPHMSGHSIRWHRSSRTAVFDLYASPDTSFHLNCSRGETHISLQYVDILERAVPQALSFWPLCSTLGELSC